MKQIVKPDIKQIMGHDVVACRGCGAPIFFSGKTPYYARKVKVLLPEGSDPHSECGPFEAMGYISHFVNCPKASSFNKGSKPAEQTTVVKREETGDNVE